MILDADGHIVGAFLAEGLSWPWGSNKANELVKIQVQATFNLAGAHPHPMPGPNSIRHPDPARERRKLEKDGQPHGIRHIGLIRLAHHD